MEISKIAIGKENTHISLMGNSVKRKPLSDITNTGSSSISNAQFQDKSKEISCIVTKECIKQILEENARLLKALGERNKIIEFTSVELQRLRIMLEKASQQNRTLAQANSQMQSELTLSKENLSTFQHELGCTMALLRSKKSELDEKNQLNKELIEKIQIATEERQVGNSMACRLDGNSLLDEKNQLNKDLIEKIQIATEERQVGNNMACRLDGNSLLDEESLNDGLCEENNAKAMDYNRAEVTTGISLLRPVSHSRDCIPERKTTRRSKALGYTTSIDIAKEKLNNESHETIRSEVEHSKCAEAATNASRSQPADSNVVCEPNRKRTTRSESLGAAATMTHQVEVQEKDPRKRSSRRISNILTTEASKSKDYMPEVVDAEIPACLAISEPPNNVEAKEKDDTRTRMSLRSKPNTLKSEACESKDYLFQIMDAELSNCKVEHSKCAEAATNASRSQPADNNMVCEPNRKRTTRSESNFKEISYVPFH